MMIFIIGKYHRPHVAPICDQTGRLAERALPIQEGGAQGRQHGNRRGSVADALVADFVARVLAFEHDAAARKANVQIARNHGQRALVGQRDAAPFGRERSEAVQRAAVEYVKTEGRADSLCNAALARRCRTIDGQDRHRMRWIVGQCEDFGFLHGRHYRALFWRPL